MDISGEEADTKRFMAAACDQTYGLFDSSKVEGFGLHSFAATDSITGLYTDDRVAPEFVTRWERIGVPVIAAPPRIDTGDRYSSLLGTSPPR